MKYSTQCKNCIFAKDSHSDIPCEFYIIDQLKENKQDDLKIVDNYYQINNYRCLYGFSKEKIDDINPLLKDISIKDYIIEKNYIKYYLLIDNMLLNSNPSSIVTFVNNLIIKPKVVSIITKTEKPQLMIDYFNENIAESVVWRIHNFYNEMIDSESAVYSIMSTNKYLDTINYLWIINDIDLDNRIKSKEIEQINHTINIIQPSIGILNKKGEDYFNGLFLTKKNYLMLTQTINQSIKKATKEFIEMNKVQLVEYD